jgi:hypothetical protein
VVNDKNLYVGHSKSQYVLARNAGIFLSKGWDFQDFLKNGIDVEIVKACDDAMAQQVIKVAEDGRKQ